MRPPVPPTFTFLFRTDVGRIDRATWWRGSAVLAGPLVLLTIGWIAIAPWTHRGLGQRKLIDIPSLIAYVYLLAYALAIILIAISFYNLSAKRWHDRGRPGALAGLFLVALLFAGAAHWLVPRSEGFLPIWIALVIDFITFLIAVWTIVELGFLAGTQEKR